MKEDKLYEKRREKVGFLLKRARECSKLKQKDIARKLGHREEVISRFESGERRIDIAYLISYCEVLDLTLTEFAWQIESHFPYEKLLSFPKKNILKKKIRVEVSWCGGEFSATFDEFVPKSEVFTGKTFNDLKIEIGQGFVSQIKEKAADVNKLPRWIKKEEYEFEYKFLDATSLLQAYRSYVSLATISDVSKINQNLLSQYLNGNKKASPNQVKRITDAIHLIGKELMVAVP